MPVFQNGFSRKVKICREQAAGTWRAEGKRERFANKTGKKHERRQARAGRQDSARNGNALPSQTSRDGAQGTARQEPRYFYGQEQTAGQAGDKNTVTIRDGIQDGRSASDLAAGGWIQAGYGLDTGWIQEPVEVQHPRLWRGCSLSWSEGVRKIAPVCRWIRWGGESPCRWGHRNSDALQGCLNRIHLAGVTVSVIP